MIFTTHLISFSITNSLNCGSLPINDKQISFILIYLILVMNRHRFCHFMQLSQLSLSQTAFLWHFLCSSSTIHVYPYTYTKYSIIHITLSFSLVFFCTCRQYNKNCNGMRNQKQVLLKMRHISQRVARRKLSPSNQTLKKKPNPKLVPKITSNINQVVEILR